MSDRYVFNGTAAGRHELRSGQLVQRCALIASGRAELTHTECFFLLKPVGINVLGSLGCIFSCEDVRSRSAKQLDTFRTLGDSAGAGGSMVSSPGFLRASVLHFADLYFGTWQLLI